MEKYLNEFNLNEKGKVKKIEAEGKIKRRLFDMGVTPNTEIILRKYAPLGDPIEVNAIIDTIVTEEGKFTKGTAVIISSAATVIKKMLTLSEEEGKEVSLDNIDANDLLMKMSSDFVNFAIISFAVIGEDTEEGKIIYDTINNLVGSFN